MFRCCFLRLYSVMPSAPHVTTVPLVMSKQLESSTAATTVPSGPSLSSNSLTSRRSLALSRLVPSNRQLTTDSIRSSPTLQSPCSPLLSSHQLNSTSSVRTASASFQRRPVRLLSSDGSRAHLNPDALTMIRCLSQQLSVVCTIGGSQQSFYLNRILGLDRRGFVQTDTAVL